MKRSGENDLCGCKSKVMKCVSSTLPSYEEVINAVTPFAEDGDLNTTTDSKESWFSYLPDEVMLHVFSFLNFQELMLTASFVNKRWHRLSEDPSLLTEFSLRGSDIPLDAVLAFLKKATRLKSLEMVKRNDVNPILHQVLKYNTQLESLVIKECQGSEHTSNIAEDVMCLLQIHLKNLRTLTVKDSQFICSSFFKLLRHTLPALKKFSFKYVWPFEMDCPLEFHEQVSELEELGCQYFPLTASDCTRLTKKFSHSLVVLKLNAHNLTDENMEEISNCHKLQKLYLDYAESIHDFGLFKISKLHLRSLYISCASNVTPRGWINFFRSPNLRCLRKLCVVACITATDRVLNVIACNCRELEAVSMPFCFNVSGEGFSNIVEMCKKIKLLNIYDGTSIHSLEQSNT